MNLAHKKSQQEVDGGLPATVTNLAAELRRARARCCGLPSAVSERGWRQGVVGALVEALQWWRSDEGKLALAMAMAALSAEAATATVARKDEGGGRNGK